MRLENMTPQVTPIPSEELLGVHGRLSTSLAWMDVKEYMDMSSQHATGKTEDVYC